MATRLRSVALVTFVVAMVGGCSGAGTTTSAPSASSNPTPGASTTATASPSAATAVTPVPPGRVVFHRRGPGEVEHYFAIDTDGTDETPLYGAEGCGCAHLSFDGRHVLSIGPTGHGTWSLMTLNLDGSDQAVVDPPIETLNLFIGASSADGRVLAFNGMDETNPANTGLWIASPSLEDARQVTRLLEGWLTIEPFGVTPDGSKIVFFAETGPNGGATHGGDLYVINADGTGLRQLNPGGPTKPAYMGMPVISLSPDGSRAAFGVADAVFIVELAGGEAHAITPRSGFVWAVTWSPTDDWLTYTRLHGRTPVIALVRPDGSDNHEISPIDETDEANAAVWSQDGDFLLVRRDLDVTTDELNDLWIMGLDGTWIGQVTHQPSSYGTYTWAPAPGS